MIRSRLHQRSEQGVSVRISIGVRCGVLSHFLDQVYVGGGYILYSSCAELRVNHRGSPPSTLPISSTAVVLSLFVRTKCAYVCDVPFRHKSHSMTKKVCDPLQLHDDPAANIPDIFPLKFGIVCLASLFTLDIFLRALETGTP